MKKRDFIFFTLLFTLGGLSAQVNKDSITDIQEIIITGKAPVSKERITRQQLDEKNLGQDIPFLLKNNLSVVSTSDAGTGIGYTGIRIRGSDQTRINVTLDGVPVNDAESQGPFWINMPDLTSSVSNLTIQRGVGTSSEGTGSFGASINVQTQSPSDSAYFQTDQSLGSFNTYKSTFGAGTGKFFNQTLKIDGRISFIKSDGYIDRASSNLFSYYTHGTYEKNNTKIGFMVFGGKEKTYQAWNGVNEETMNIRRTFNSCGAIYDENGNIVRYYDNETDNYRQDHYHLYFEQKLSPKWKFKSTLFYVKGKGYYEEYEQNQNLEDYKLDNIVIGNETITKTDLVRRQWLDNDFYGISNRLLGSLGKWSVEAGLGANNYEGFHYGNVIWAEYFSNGEPNHEYYRNKAVKTEITGYIKALYTFTNTRWELFGDVQYRNIHYTGHDMPGGESTFKNGGPLQFSENYNFVNPKIGSSYKINRGNMYITYGIAQREPSRDDILNNENVKPEFMQNIEVGIRQTFSKFTYSANWYGMYYINQLVLSGKINDVGTFIRENSGKSFRMGIELSAGYQFSSKFQVTANSTFSINKNIDFKQETNTGIVNLGNTTIAFSPSYIGNLIIEWKPIKNLTGKLLNQYVGWQYLSNEQPENGKLDGYFTSDLVLEYSPDWFHLKNFSLKLLLNNLWNAKYESNGYYYENTPYYYPQAGFNFLTGLSIRF